MNKKESNSPVIADSKKKYERPFLAEQGAMAFPKEILKSLSSGEEIVFQCFHCNCSTH